MNKKKIIVLAVSVLTVALAGTASAANLGSRLKGRILLQVQQKGEAWYVNPSSGERSYMGKASDAFGLMRKTGVGISNSDIAKIQVGDKNLTSASSTDTDGDGLSDTIESALGTNVNSTDTDGDGTDDKTEILNGYDPNSSSTVSMIDADFAKKEAGKILLQVQSHGEAWYVNPADNKRYFLGSAQDAFNVMRELGLGISNSDLRQINENGKKSTSTNATKPNTANKNGKNDKVNNDKKASSTPQELVTACSGLSSGDFCSFIFNNATATGTCSAIGNQLACKSSSMMNRPGKGMSIGQVRNGMGSSTAPQELIVACSSLSVGDSCSFTNLNNATATGTCATMGGQLMCKSNNMMRDGLGRGTGRGPGGMGSSTAP